jgi:uncharacterized protein
MKIGLISDTHDNIRNIKKAVTIFKDKNVGFVLHAGDFVNAESVEPFEGIKLIGVLGNNDIDVRGLTNAFNNINGELRGEFCEIEQDNMRLVVYHGTKPHQKDSLIESGKYDVVIYGHTHRLEKRNLGKVIVLNPGTANGWFFGYKATIAIFDTHTKYSEFISL